MILIGWSRRIRDWIVEAKLQVIIYHDSWELGWRELRQFILRCISRHRSTVRQELDIEPIGPTSSQQKYCCKQNCTCTVHTDSTV